MIRAKLDQYDPLFKSYMERVKEELPSCMPKDCVPSIDMSLWRSLQRGSTHEVGNQNLDETAINLNNRWRKMEKGRGSGTQTNMQMVYTMIMMAIVTRLRYSQAL